MEKLKVGKEQKVKDISTHKIRVPKSSHQPVRVGEMVDVFSTIFEKPNRNEIIRRLFNNY